VQALDRRILQRDHIVLLSHDFLKLSDRSCCIVYHVSHLVVRDDLGIVLLCSVANEFEQVFLPVGRNPGCELILCA
jgi:hypothetical protein